MADDPKSLAQLLRALTGSEKTGDYPDTLVDHINLALDAAWDLVNARGLNVPVIAGDDLGPWETPTTVLGDIREQVLSRFRYDAASRPRTLSEAARQLEALVAALNEESGTSTPPPAGGGSLPAGTSQGTLSWAAKMSAANSKDAGYSSNVQRQYGSGSIQNSQDPIPIGAAPEGSRGLVLSMAAGQGRLEVRTPLLQSIGSNQDFWLGFWFVGDQHVEETRSDWSIIMQVHGNDTTSPHQILAVDGGDFITGNAKTLKRFHTNRIKKNTRYNVVMNVRANSAGTMSIWVNHEKVLDNYAAGLNNLPGYLKVGWYRQPSNAPAAKMWVGGHRIGTGYGAVYPT